MPKRKRPPITTEHHDEARTPKSSKQSDSDDDHRRPEYQSFTIPQGDNKKPTSCLRSSSSSHQPSLIFTHGAGGNLSTPATADFLSGFAGRAPLVAFQGTMNLTSRVRAFETAIQHEVSEPAGTGGGSGSIALGGRSMGARAAVIASLHQAVEGTGEETRAGEAVVCISYPLLATNSGGKFMGMDQQQEVSEREQILLELPAETDVLFVSGTRDGMCPLPLLEDVTGRMKARCWVVEVEGADHGMGLVGKKGEGKMRRRTGEVVAAWLGERDDGRRLCGLRWDGEEGVVVSTGWQDERTQGEAKSGSENG